MNFKKILLISILLLSLSLSAVSASDYDGDNHVIESSDIDGSLSVGDSFLGSSRISDSNVLSAAAGTFDDLQLEINNVTDGSVLTLERDYYGNYGSRIELSKDLTIDGQGHTLDCLNEGGCSAFYSSYGNIVLKNLIIINGHNDFTNKGGAIHITDSAQYVLINCTFKGNWANFHGGAICNEVDKQLKIIGCTFISNEADDENGGAVSSKGDVTIEDSTFDSNSAFVDGGAVYGYKNVNANNCLFKSNSAYGALLSSCYGGAICAGGDVTVNNCTFMYNRAENAGGAIYSKRNVYINSNQGVKDYNSFFINNTAEGSFTNQCPGGAVYAHDKAYAKNAVFSGNHARSYGGAIYGSLIDANHCLFENNTSRDHGGAVGYVHSIVNVDNCIFRKNYAHFNGGAIKSESVTINNSTFDGNTAEESGGAVYTVHLTIKHTPSYFINNFADERHEGKGGGAIFTSSVNGDIKYVTFKNNSAGYHSAPNFDGGAVYIDSKTAVTFSNCVFISNFASDEGGAIYVDDDSSEVSLINNVFIGNSADEGKSVYNCGVYKTISNNIWKTTPAKDNDELIEWKAFASNVHHVDSDPLKIDLVLNSTTCVVGNSVTATMRFLKSDGSVFSGEMFDINQISFSPYPEVEFGNKEVGKDKVSVEIIPLTEGMYTVYAGFYGFYPYKSFNAYDLDVIAPEVTTFTNVPVTFKVHLEGDKEVSANQNVRVSFFKHYYSVTDENGDAYVTFCDDLNREPGNYLVEVLSNGIAAKSAVNIITSIVAQDVVQVRGDNVVFKAQFTDNSGAFLKKSTQVPFVLDNANPYYSAVKDDEGNVLAQFNSLSRGEHKVVVTNPDNGETKTYRIVILAGFGAVNNNADVPEQKDAQINNVQGQIEVQNNNSVNVNSVDNGELTGDLYYDYSLFNDAVSSDDNAGNHSKHVSKSVDEPLASSSGNGNLWIVLLVIAIVAAGALIWKNKSY